MTVGLAPGISYAFVEDRAVVLDQRADRYCALSPALSALLRAHGEGEPIATDAAQRLRRAGVLADTMIPIAPVTHATGRTSALERGIDRRATLGNVGRATAAVIGVRVAVGPGRLAAVLDARARRVAAARLSHDPVRAAAIARDFDAARRWVPLPRICLSDALALSRILTARGVAHQLIFGVRLTPFFAHAWLEADGTILSDRRDAIAGLTPVLVA